MSERNRKIERLFAECFGLPLAERAAYLDSACPGDSAVRAEVESLLAASDNAGSFLEKLDDEKVTALAQSAPEILENESVGAYRLIRELGRGGMGVVYLAERADGQFEQQVALKLIKRGMDSDEIQRRFLNERQILARLQHPNVARLLDGGVTDQGQPFFAMEYVNGIPLIEHCDKRRMTVDQRLTLFLEVCAAVQYAHQNLIVHRDLKPSNLLVTPSGEIKLLDFGIAKLLDTESSSAGATQTAANLRMVTPEYGSPEQIRGEPVTTSTDVYALGVILYELLVGRRPYRIEERTPAAVARVVGEVEAEKPSAVVGAGEHAASITRARGTTAARLRRALRGDLDTIVLKALRKEPRRRFASVGALLDDLERYLSGLPVRARPDTLAYRSAKFLRRHALAVGAVALVIVALASGLTVALWQKRIATQEAAKAAEVKDFLIEIFEVSDPRTTMGDEVTARELLDRGAERVAEDLAEQPEIQAEMMHLIGSLYSKLGLYDRALTQLERSLEIRRRELGQRHLAVSASLHDAGTLLIDMAEYERAERMLTEALEIRRAQLGNQDPAVAKILDGLGLLFAEVSRYDEAESVQREALAIYRRTLGDATPEVAGVLSNLGLTLRWSGNFEAAEPIHREALELKRRIYGNDHVLVAWALEHLGVGLAQRGDYATADPLLREGFEIMKRSLGDEHPDTVLATNNLAKVLSLTGNQAEAEPLFRRALALNTQIHGAESRFVSTNLTNLGQVMVGKGDYEKAVDYHTRALAIRRKLLGEEHPRFAQSLHYLAYARMLRGDASGVEPLFQQAIRIGEEAWESDHPYLAMFLAGYGEFRIRQGRYEAAEPLLLEALRIREKILVAGHWERGEAQSLLGECLAGLRRFEEAEPLLLEGYSTIKERRGPNSVATRRARRALASFYVQQGKPQSAAIYAPDAE